MNVVHFYHQNQEYPIERDILDKYTTYFSTKNITFDYVPLVDELDLIFQKIPEETINEFIQYFEKDMITLNDDNIFPIKHLSTKFEVPSLIKQANIYIRNNYKSLISKILHDKKENININSEEEKILSLHLLEYIKEDKLLSLPIPNLYRILIKHYNYQQKNEEEEEVKEEAATKSTDECELDESEDNLQKKKDLKKPFKRKSRNYPKKKLNKQVKSKNKKKSPKKHSEKDKDKDLDDDNSDDDKFELKDKDEENEEHQIISFLIKILKKRGREASVLLNAVSFSKTGNEYLIEKLYEAGDDIEIDFNILKTQLIKYLYEQNQENKEQSKSNIKQLNQMRSEFELQIDQMKNQYEAKIKEIEEKQIRFKNEMMISMMDQIESIKIEMNNMQQEIKDNQMISEERNTKINKNIEIGKSTNFIIMNNIKNRGNLEINKVLDFFIIYIK